MTDFTIEEFLAWARTKPADEEYDYSDPGNCALCQFLRATGRAKEPSVGPHDWNELGSAPRHQIAPALNTAVCRAWKNGSPFEGRSFGALVVNLEALVQEAKPSPWLNPQTYIEADVGKVPA